MIASKRRINAQKELLDHLDSKLDDLNKDYEKVLAGWNVEGITDPTDMEELIREKRNEIEAEEAKLAEMEAAYNGSEVEKSRHWKKKRVEPALFSFC